VYCYVNCTGYSADWYHHEELFEIYRGLVAAHKGDLAAAQSSWMHTAYVGVPEDDNL
jgi:hypothetical protein